MTVVGLVRSTKERQLGVDAGLYRNISSRPPSGQSTVRTLTLTPPLNRGEEAGYMIIIQRLGSAADTLLL